MINTNDFDVIPELTRKTATFVNAHTGYGDLRTKCLAGKAIQSIIDSVLVDLRAVADREKIEKSAQLTATAHQQQIEADITAATNEGKLLIDTTAKIDRLTQSVETCAAQWNQNQREHAIQERQLATAKAELEVTMVQPSTRYGHPSQHHPLGNVPARYGHPSQRHPLGNVPAAEEAQDPYIAGLSLAVGMRRIEITRLEIEHARLKRALDGLFETKRNLEKCTLERDERQKFREQRFQSYHDKALSPSSLDRLKISIKESKEQIDSLVSKKMQQAQESCHLVFLNQLEYHLETLRLAPEEKTVLSRLIVKMRAYHVATADVEEQQRILLCKRAESSEASQAAWSASGRSSELLQTNKQCAAQNIQLAQALPGLKAQEEKYLLQRNRAAKYVMVLMVLASIVAVTAFLLMNAGVITLAPIVPIVFVSVVTGAALGLITFSIVAAIRASFQGSNVRKNEQQQQRNEQQMAANTSSRAQLDTTLAQLIGQQVLKKQALDLQNAFVARAEAVARTILQEAKEITLDKTGSGLCGYPGTLLAQQAPIPSAPPAFLVIGYDLPPSYQACN